MKLNQNNILLINTHNYFYNAKGKTALDLSGITNSYSLTTDNTNLYVITDDKTYAISNYTKLKYYKDKNLTEYIDLINAAIVVNTLEYEFKPTIKGSNFNDTINLTSPTKAVNINSGKGNDTITVNDSNYIVKATSSSGSNNITINNSSRAIVTTGAGNDTVNFNNVNGNNSINTGNGINHVSITGTGKNTVKTGKDNDVIFSENNITEKITSL